VNFATLFDRNYIPRAEVMMDSLMSQMGEGFTKIFVLSLDGDVNTYFSGNSKVECIPLSVLEDFFPELELAKKNRSNVEYIFTLSPFFPLFLLKKFPEMKRITSLDSDLYFFSSPKNLLETLKEDKIGITAHNFPKELSHLEKFGMYNVSFQSFPNTELGIKCLQDWAEDCLEFCGDFLDHQGRFADQKYLDFWQEKYGIVEVFPSPEIGLAPWNIHSFQLDFEAPNLHINGMSIIFYHFQGLRIKSNNRFLLGLTNYLENEKPSKNALSIYTFYISKLLKKGRTTDLKIKRLQTSSANGFQSLVDDLRVQPVLFKVSLFTKYLDFRKVVDFAEKKLKITRWQN
jgi:hypothetical protein